jgi:dihydrofolate synthase/folylpolyglutamate synthase
LQQLGRDFQYVYQPGRVGPTGDVPAQVQVRTRTREWPVLALNLPGEHQAANAAVTLTCVEELRRQGWHVPDAAVARGLAEVRWPARLELVGRRPLVVLDCAHNVASACAVVDTLQASFPPTRRVLIFAGSTDKDLPGMCRVLAPCFEQAFVTRYTSNPRSADPEKLAGWLAEAGNVQVTITPTPLDAWRQARDAAGPDDLICITGSVFLAGELRPVVLAE